MRDWRENNPCLLLQSVLRRRLEMKCSKSLKKERCFFFYFIICRKLTGECEMRRVKNKKCDSRRCGVILRGQRLLWNGSFCFILILRRGIFLCVLFFEDYITWWCVCITFFFILLWLKVNSALFLWYYPPSIPTAPRFIQFFVVRSTYLQICFKNLHSF